jgi:hypothetical protein
MQTHGFLERRDNASDNVVEGNVKVVVVRRGMEGEH